MVHYPSHFAPVLAMNPGMVQSLPQLKVLCETFASWKLTDHEALCKFWDPSFGPFLD